jgi:hypothetical protein
MKIKSPKDFWAGLMFIAFGLFFLFFALDYKMGSLTRMGPAYFPTVLSSLMVAFGCVILFRSLVLKGERIPAMTFRPVFIIVLSLILFGYLIAPIGLALALVFLVIFSSFAGHEIKIKEVVILSVGMTILSLLVFVKGLGLPFPIWPMFLN